MHQETHLGAQWSTKNGQAQSLQARELHAHVVVWSACTCMYSCVWLPSTVTIHEPASGKSANNITGSCTFNVYLDICRLCFCGGRSAGILRCQLTVQCCYFYFNWRLAGYYPLLPNKCYSLAATLTMFDKLNFKPVATDDTIIKTP